MGFDSCCGTMPKGRPQSVKREKLPDNPQVDSGVRVIFVGSGKLKVEGAASGLTYTLADFRRHFEADPRDVPDLLRSRDFILET